MSYCLFSKCFGKFAAIYLWPTICEFLKNFFLSFFVYFSVFQNSWYFFGSLSTLQNKYEYQRTAHYHHFWWADTSQHDVIFSIRLFFSWPLENTKKIVDGNIEEYFWKRVILFLLHSRISPQLSIKRRIFMLSTSFCFQLS